MRISDWSSDVCSSDLQRRPDRETVAMLRPPEMKRHKHQRAQQVDDGNDDEPRAQQRQARKRPGSRKGIGGPDQQDRADRERDQRRPQIAARRGARHAFAGAEEAIPVGSARSEENTPELQSLM